MEGQNETKEGANTKETHLDSAVGIRKKEKGKIITSCRAVVPSWTNAKTASQRVEKKSFDQLSPRLYYLFGCLFMIRALFLFNIFSSQSYDCVDETPYN